MKEDMYHRFFIRSGWRLAVSGHTYTDFQCPAQLSVIAPAVFSAVTAASAVVITASSLEISQTISSLEILRSSFALLN